MVEEQVAKMPKVRMRRDGKNAVVARRCDVYFCGTSLAEKPIDDVVFCDKVAT